MDDSDLRRCIRHLVRQASQDNDSQEDSSETTSPDDDDYLESNQEYQDLVREVEAKLIEFLEGQVTLLDDESAYTNNSNTTEEEEDEGNLSKLPIHKAHAYPCNDSFKELPASPEKWPQRCVWFG